MVQVTLEYICYGTYTYLFYMFIFVLAHLKVNIVIVVLTLAFLLALIGTNLYQNTRVTSIGIGLFVLGVPVYYLGNWCSKKQMSLDAVGKNAFKIIKLQQHTNFHESGYLAWCKHSLFTE